MADLATLLLGYRYVLFVLFIVCNAIICSVAVWNYSMVSGLVGHIAQIDAYLMFVGAMGIVFLIPTVAIDIFRNNAIVNRVWFECLWVGIFWVMELAGASALTASVSNMVCVPAVNSIIKDVCTSNTVLMTFTWIITILLLVHLLALTLSAVLHQEDAQVWHAGVRTFEWFAATRASLGSTPPSPVRQMQQKPLQLVQPRPQRPVRQATLDRDLESGIEHIPKAEPSYAPARRAPPPPPQDKVAHSLYPAYLKSNLPSQPGVSQPTGATPPPLGDWPRSSRIPTRDISAQSQQMQAPSLPTARPRPGHPRKGSNGSPSRQRPIPPPLDLTRISAYRTIDDRVSRR